MRQQQSEEELLFEQVSNKDVEGIIKSLRHDGANPLVLNDDFKTPLEVARTKGYSNVVRAIESHICLFSGWMREFCGPSFLEFFAPQLLSRRVWVVIVPTTKPFKLELAVYASLQDAQPKMVMSLWKANLEEPKSYQSDASVMIVDNSTSPKRRRTRRRRSFVSQGRRWVRVDTQIRLKLAAATQGDMQQLNWFCEACKGITQPMNLPMFLQASQTTTTTTTSSPLPSQDASVDLAHVNMSLPSANCENKEDGMCVICNDASSEAVCVPCGHVAGCISCLKEIKDKTLGCPICRANIDQVIKLYHV